MLNISKATGSEAISRQVASGNTTSGNTTSGNTTSGNTTLGSTTSGQVTPTKAALSQTTSNIERVVLVDSKDQIIGTEEKLQAHKLGLLHRAFSIFIYRIRNSKENKGFSIEFLLQQRHINKYHAGGLWTNTCCSHPRLQEDILIAGQRRLREELSLSIPLIAIGSFQYRAVFPNGLIEHEYDHVLLGEYKGESYCFDPVEVQALRWVSLSDLEVELYHSPELYTPWLKPALTIVSEYL